MYLIAQLNQWYQSLGHLLWPKYCLHCQALLSTHEQYLCTVCFYQIELASDQYCMAKSLDLQHHPLTAWGIMNHESPLRSLIHHFKYEGRIDIGKWLGRQLGDRVNAQGWVIDGIVPVPLHSKRLFKRGYNQSTIIANSISKVIGKPVMNTLVSRAIHTTTQTSKTKLERQQNVAHAFACIQELSLESKNLLLVDDVCTSGATLMACSAVLQSKGAHVKFSTIALASL
jgi:ComF family protein